MLAKNPVFHAKTKHIAVKYHFIQDVLEDKHMELVKVYTIENPVDQLTKGLPSESFAHCHDLMGVGELVHLCPVKMYNMYHSLHNYPLEFGFPIISHLCTNLKGLLTSKPKLCMTLSLMTHFCASIYICI